MRKHLTDDVDVAFACNKTRELQPSCLEPCFKFLGALMCVLAREDCGCHSVALFSEPEVGTAPFYYVD